MDALYELERQEDEVRRRLRRQFGDQEERIRREEPFWTRPIRNRHGGLRSQIVACGRMRDALGAVMRAEMLDGVPPLSPHVTMKEMRAYTEALMKGDPDARGIIKATLKQVFA